jgi:hypothetical protein
LLAGGVGAQTPSAAHAIASEPGVAAFAARAVGPDGTPVAGPGAVFGGGAQQAVAEQPDVLIGRYCLRCHNDAMLTGGLTLESFRVADAGGNAAVAEKMIRKLLTGMMPPASAQRPDAATYAALVGALESTVDAAVAAAPPPGGRTFQRLNRAEYERSIQDLLGLRVDAGAWLPPDTVSAGFDNIADVQGLSTTVMEGFLSAAGEISRMAVGDPGAGPAETTYEVPRYVSQRERVEGAPFGSRGGLSVMHTFPANGDYRFTMHFYDSPIAMLYGKTTYHDEQIEISIDGERVAMLDVDRLMDADNEYLQSDPVWVQAGPRRLTAAFVKKMEGPVPDVLSPHAWSLADKDIGAAFGVTTLPHLRDLAVAGPYGAGGVAASPSRARVFTCRPTAADEQRECAARIVADLARRAYRRPTQGRDLEPLMGFWESGAATSGFEGGVRAALEAILASPHFVFRFEQTDGSGTTRLDDVALASRLSFFLWGAPPDAELVTLADAGELSRNGNLERQVARMLDDPRAAALGTRFAAQWLRLQDLDKVHPDALTFPDYDQQLADAMRRETELFFEDLVARDGSVLELLTADATFVNERLARHYGIDGVVGDEFRRVRLPGDARRGLLGQGSILTMTSHADRTSPVLRGKWVMQVLLGSPPPPPPPDVPELEATAAVEDGRFLTVRERLEMHRANPACNSCHRMIDPIGLALENFDVTGVWRIKDHGAPVDPLSTFYDGTPVGSPSALRAALLRYRTAFVTTFTENLMAYALGRRIEHTDMPSVRAIVRAAAEHDDRLSSFILGVVESPAFQQCTPATHRHGR